RPPMRTRPRTRRHTRAERRGAERSSHPATGSHPSSCRGAARHARAEVSLVPRNAALEEVDALLHLADAVAGARIEYQLGFHAHVAEGDEELLRLRCRNVVI